MGLSFRVDIHPTLIIELHLPFYHLECLFLIPQLHHSKAFWRTFPLHNVQNWFVVRHLHLLHPRRRLICLIPLSHHHHNHLRQVLHKVHPPEVLVDLFRILIDGLIASLLWDWKRENMNCIWRCYARMVTSSAERHNFRSLWSDLSSRDRRSSVLLYFSSRRVYLIKDKLWKLRKSSSVGNLRGWVQLVSFNCNSCLKTTVENIQFLY